MENFDENRIFGDAFLRYLKERFNWEYKTIDPITIVKPKEYPDIDLVLISESEKEKYLYFQLKKPLKFEKVVYMMTKSWLKVFEINDSSFQKTVNKAESKYKKDGNDISNIIFLLNINKQYGYLTQDDAERIGKFPSNFRGVYIVVPKYSWSSLNKGSTKEFVYEIKNAFN